MLSTWNVVQVQRTFDDYNVEWVHHTDHQILPFLGPSPPVILLAYTHQVKGGAPIEGEACQLWLCPGLIQHAQAVTFNRTHFT